MSRIFGGEDPFDDPFFTRPFGSLFGSSIFGSGSSPKAPPHVNCSKGPVITELDSDGEREVEEEDNADGYVEKKDKYKEDAWANQNPLVEHPEDQSDGHSKSKDKNKEVSHRVNYGKAERTKPQMRSVSFQRVTYGGTDGAYYTATTSRRAGSDGVVLEETKQADKTTGQATHRLSRGIHDKGHSFIRKLNSDGQVDTTHTLHNLNEDELPGFEQIWEGNADRHLPGWDDGFDFFSNTGTGYRAPTNLAGWALPFREGYSGFGGLGQDRDGQSRSTGGNPKKVVRINIE